MHQDVAVLNLDLFVHLRLADYVHEAVPRVDEVKGLIEGILGLEIEPPGRVGSVGIKRFAFYRWEKLN